MSSLCVCLFLTRYNSHALWFICTQIHFLGLLTYDTILFVLQLGSTNGANFGNNILKNSNFSQNSKKRKTFKCVDYNPFWRYLMLHKYSKTRRFIRTPKTPQKYWIKSLTTLLHVCNNSSRDFVVPFWIAVYLICYSNDSWLPSSLDCIIWHSFCLFFYSQLY